MDPTKAIGFAIAAALVASGGCLGHTGDAGGTPSAPSRPDAPAVPAIPRLDNASWPEIARVVEALDRDLADEHPGSLASGTGGQFVVYQHAAAYDLARGWLREALYHTAIAFSYVKRSQIEASGERSDMFSRENDALERELVARLAEDDTSLCRMEAGYLLTQAGVHAGEIGDLRASGEPDAEIARQEAFRWARLHVARALTDAECARAEPPADLVEWAEDLNGRAAALPPRSKQDAETATFDAKLAQWAEERDLAATTRLLAVRDTLQTVLRVMNGTEPPSFEQVAALARVAHDSRPDGLRTWIYGVGTYTYDHAERGVEIGVVDPLMRWVAYVAFAEATGEPWRYLDLESRLARPP